MSKSIKKITALVLAALLLTLCFAGCSSEPAPTEAPTAAPTEAPTEAPTAAPTEAPTEAPIEAPTETPTEAPTEPPVLYRHPLTGEPLDEPITSRVFAFSINNQIAALPHVGTQEADMLFEMYVNGYMTRCLALYTDIASVEAIGSIRSMRYNFTDICQAYDAFMCHASGSEEVLKDMNASKVDNIWVAAAPNISYRDQERRNNGYDLEHTLMVDGPVLYQYLVDNDYRVTTNEENKTYGLKFAEDGTPAGGEDASVINITFRIKHEASKLSTMTYNQETGRYVYTQYDRDGSRDDPENFENVFVMMTEVKNKSAYHIANLSGSGEGYYACNGKIVPIKWHHESDTAPFVFTYVDGTPLEQGIGNSYVAIVSLESTIEWE